MYEKPITKENLTYDSNYIKCFRVSIIVVTDGSVITQA